MDWWFRKLSIPNLKTDQQPSQTSQSTQSTELTEFIEQLEATREMEDKIKPHVVTPPRTPPASIIRPPVRTATPVITPATTPVRSLRESFQDIERFTKQVNKDFQEFQKIINFIMMFGIKCINYLYEHFYRPTVSTLVNIHDRKYANNKLIMLQLLFVYNIVSCALFSTTILTNYILFATIIIFIKSFILFSIGDYACTKIPIASTFINGIVLSAIITMFFTRLFEWLNRY